MTALGTQEKTTIKNAISEILDLLNIESGVNVTSSENNFYRNRIIFGAPGTGKSYLLNKEQTELLNSGGSFERVTFHPDYTYANISLWRIKMKMVQILSLTSMCLDHLCEYLQKLC